MSVWFKPGSYLAAGDVGPFTRRNLDREIWSVWNHQNVSTGGPDTTSAASRTSCCSGRPMGSGFRAGPRSGSFMS
ncbi:hypothetical protein ACFQ9X_50810 [Catenulispora yoronensis]